MAKSAPGAKKTTMEFRIKKNKNYHEIFIMIFTLGNMVMMYIVPLVIIFHRRKQIEPGHAIAYPNDGVSLLFPSRKKMTNLL